MKLSVEVFLLGKRHSFFFFFPLSLYFNPVSKLQFHRTTYEDFFSFPSQCLCTYHCLSGILQDHNVAAWSSSFRLNDVSEIGVSYFLCLSHDGQFLTVHTETENTTITRALLWFTVFVLPKNFFKVFTIICLHSISCNHYESTDFVSFWHNTTLIHLRYSVNILKSSI